MAPCFGTLVEVEGMVSVSEGVGRLPRMACRARQLEVERKLEDGVGDLVSEALQAEWWSESKMLAAGSNIVRRDEVERC